MDNTAKIKSEIMSLLNSGKEIDIKWDCGGDEAILSFFINDKQISYDNKLVEMLDIYLINHLALPSAGEFAMEGGGKIILENNQVFIEYYSEVSYAEGVEEEEDLTAMGNHYSGKTKLF